MCGPINSPQSTTHSENNQHATVPGKEEGNVQAWLRSTLVGVRVPGTDGTSQPLICRIVCRTVRVCECAHVKRRESTFWVHWETGRHDNGHLLARTRAQSEHEAEMTDRQTGSAHPHTTASTATLIIRALAGEKSDQYSPSLSLSNSLVSQTLTLMLI